MVRGSTLIMWLLLGAGILSLSAGGYLYYYVQPATPTVVLWLENNTALDPNSNMLLWGSSGPANSPNDLWKFKITLIANSTIQLRLLWSDEPKVLFEREGQTIKEDAQVNLRIKNVAWEWTWQIINPSNKPVNVEQLQIEYHAFGHTERSNARILLGLGVAAITLSVITAAERRRLRQKT